MMVLAAALFLTASSCPTDDNGDDPDACVDFCGTWTGGQSDPSQQLTGPMTFTVTGTNLAGDIAPISGSTRNLTGTVSETGAVTASVPAGTNGCTVNFSGQITSHDDGSASATGTYTLVQSNTCNTNNGTWTATKAAANGN